MYTINDLYDLTHTLAADYLAGFTYPWEALAGISDLIRALGEKGDRESCRMAEEWLTVGLYALLRNYDREGCCQFPPELSHSLWEAYSGLTKARMMPGQPGAPDLSLPPELAERAENVLRGFWDEWREQV